MINKRILGFVSLAAIAAPTLGLGLMSPAQAQVGLGPKGVDHYLCYDITASSEFKPIRVKVRDQFSRGDGTVFKPISLCNPVDKNGEGILNEEGHLVCYGFDPATFPNEPRTVRTKNQFGELKAKTAKLPETLCVPSFKRVLE